jgi:DNA modification methylase
MSSVIDHIRRQVTDYEKNPYAFEKLLHAYTLPGDRVGDVFAGRGNLLIVADQLDRSYYAMDIDPRMCQLIIDRWEKLTGQKAEKAGEV